MRALTRAGDDTPRIAIEHLLDDGQARRRRTDTPPPGKAPCANSVFQQFQPPQEADSARTRLPTSWRRHSCTKYTTHNAIYTSSQTDISHVQGSFSGSFDMLTGADGSATGFVDLGAYASINSFFVAKSASAFIDPHIEIDAAFLAANPGAALTITPGVGNEISGVAAVPEPSTCALLIGGLGIVGAAVRRKARARH